MNVRRWLGGSCAAAVLAAWAASGGLQAAKKPIDWVALHPGFEGATFVNDPATCQACHEDVMNTFEHTIHSRAFTYGKAPEGGRCESCHGPRSKHVEDPTTRVSIQDLPARQQSAVCMQCHQNGTRMNWRTGPHHGGEVSCSSCHVVMERRSERAQLATRDESALCYQCHGEVRVQLNKTSHHPVREGRMACASCHNVHGNNPALMKTATVNDTCFSCHAEKRGPFVWEHAPVRESCANCHEAHGSTNRNLLTTKDPFLCLQCHSYGGHINLPRYNRTSNPYGSGCVNCHVTVHGSNHPSGVKQTR
jgi:DmsE family decaheme c-type cytochrome